MAGEPDSERRVLVLTSSGGDAEVVARLLESAGFASLVCPGAEALARELRAGAGVAIVAEEALGPGDLSLVAKALASQPKWSDLPLILLTFAGGGSFPSPADGLWRSARSRVTLVERPIQSATLLAAVHAALQSRRRQYQIRDELARLRKTEQALRHERSRLEAVLRQLPAGVIIAQAPSGKLVLGNDQVARIWRHEFIPSEGIAQYERWKGSHPDGRPYLPHEWPLARAIENGEHVEGEEIKIQRGDGSFGWIRVGAAPVHDADGSLVAGVTSFVDVTERKQLEERLVAKRARLEEADRRKDLFLATLGHELRNPLAALDLALKALEEGLGDADRLHRGMSLQVEQLTRLVNDLLEVARITRGKLSIRKARMDLVDVVRLAAQALESNIHEKKQELVFCLPTSLHVEGDATRLEQVVSNLLSNASKYTPDGGRIEVSGGREKDEVVLAVRDTGQGLEQDQLQRVFEAFVQGDPVGGGLGIGLALVKGLVELHGGSVEAGSQGPGRGCVFSVRLPIGEVGEEPAQRERSVIRPLPGPLRVLVVDDNQEFADPLALVLDRIGATTLCAYSGADGIEKTRVWSPEVVLVDLGLPDMKGYEVARRIRSLERGDGLLLLAVTGFGGEEPEEKARQAGFDERLLKPVSFERLEGLLRKWSAEKAGPAAAAVAEPPVQVGE